jgi:hypothetical protein
MEQTAKHSVLSATDEKFLNTIYRPRMSLLSLLIKIQVVSKRALQRYSKCYCAVSVTKTFTRKSVQINHRSRLPHSIIWNTIVDLFLKHLALIVEVTLNRNYPW